MENDSLLQYFQYLPVQYKLYAGFLIGFIGLFVGSFLYCLAMRLVTGESYIKGRSHCDGCGHVLSIMDLIPLFSWFMLGGKCRYCGKEVSAKYPLSELITAVSFIFVLFHFELTLDTIQYLIFTTILLCISFADIEGYIIPDELIIAGIVNRLLFILLSKDILSTLLTSLLGGIAVSLPILIIVLIMEKILKKEAMGGGDIKLFFMTGIYFTWTENIFAVLVSCFAGIIYGILMMSKNKKENTENEETSQNLIPFGPFISFGSFITMLIGSQAVNFYLSLF